MRKVWPWIVGLLILLLVGGIVYLSPELNKGGDISDNKDKGESSSNLAVENKINLQIGQVDTSAYPTCKLYLSGKQDGGEELQELETSDLVLKEGFGDSYKEVQVKSIEKFSDNEKLNMNLVIDTSGSMSGNGLLDYR